MYAFSRFRFKGRRGGLLALLLIQMFPQFLAAVALYLMFTDLGAVIPEEHRDDVVRQVASYMVNAAEHLRNA